MLKIMKKFFDFCGKTNKAKFYKALVLGVVLAMAEAMKIPAIMLMLQGMLNGEVNTTLILQCFGILAGSVAIGCVTKYFSTMLQCEGGYDTAANKRIEIAEHMRYLPMGYFNDNSLGYITSVTTNTMESLGDVATRVVMMTTQGILTTLVITVMIIIFDVRIGAVTATGIALFFLVNSILQKKSKHLAPDKLRTDTSVVEKVLEYIQGISEVKSYNLIGRASKKLNKAIDENAALNTKMELTFVPIMTLQNAIVKLTGVCITLLSIFFYIQGTLELKYCIGMIICSFIVLENLGQAGNYSALMRVVDSSIDKAQKIMDLPAMDIDGEDITPESDAIELKHVDFSYDKKKIINDISVSIPAKTTTAIVGPSGGGKTTLCHLIARFWDVDKGTITLGNRNIRDYSMDSLMKNFSFVFQNVYLFQDTIANNIRFGQENAPMEKVIEAAKKACCHDFIMELPDGYDTVIGEGGASLSGGEKQRISIARAIMKDSPIIILDEATANVDPENEKDLVTAIDELTREKTIFMIAHRLKTVRNADTILVVDKGRIVQQGKHEELMKQDGIYRRFVESRELAASWKLG